MNLTIDSNCADSLAALCPTARHKADRLHVENGSLYTAAGVTDGVDHCVYLLTQDEGSEIALSVPKRLVVSMGRTCGQSTFSVYFTSHAENNSPVAQVLQYVLSNLTGDLSVSVLARVANMSVRTFSRPFARHSKIPPAGFVECARMEAARVMLEKTALPLKTIAYECGFGEAHRMRGAFKRRLGMSPRQYRLDCQGEACLGREMTVAGAATLKCLSDAIA